MLKKNKLLNYDDNKLNEVKKRLNFSLSDDDLKKYLGENVEENIIKYSDLINYNNIEELLPKNRTYKIILIETEYNKGHWVCILRYKDYENNNIDTIDFFNSYGNKPTSQLSYIKSCVNFLLGQNSNFLKNLLDKTDKRVIYNKKRFQKYSNKINTCGRHVVSRIIAMEKLFYDLEDYIEFIEKSKEKFNCDSDIVVSIYIPSIE